MTTGDVKSARSRGGPTARLRPLLVPLVSLIVLAIAAIVIYGLTREIHLSDIRRALSAISGAQVGAALALTALSFGALALFDVLAVASAAPGVISYRRAAFAGALGYAISNTLGFSALTGGALRFRIYAAEGIDASRIMSVIVTSYLSFWFGFTAVLAAAILFDANNLADLRIGPPALALALAATIAGLLAGTVVWTGAEGRAVTWRRWTFAVPPRRILLAQIATGAVDMAASAAVLYVLLPPDMQPGLAFFAVAYAGGVLLGVLSHAPGGLGVFEATLVAALGREHGAETLGALIAYRLIYYIVPFVIGVVALAATESLRHRERLSATALETSRILQPVVPVAAGAMAFIAGLILLVSGALPPSAQRSAALMDLVPLPLLEMSHLLGSVIGVVLLILARGLVRRNRTAWAATIALIAAGAVVSIVKRLGVEEAVALTAAGLLLLLFRPAFYRRSDLAALRLSPGWLAMVVAAFVAVTWLGFFSHRHVAYANELWWQFEWRGDAPRFMRASVAVAAVLVWAAATMLVARPPRGAFEPDPVDDTIRRIVRASPATQANVAYLADKKFLADPGGRAFLMYGESGKSLVTMGDPVGDPAAGIELIWRFRELADREGLRPVYYAVSPAFLPTFLDMGLALLKIGEVARVELASFSLEGKRRQDFRYADRKAEKEGLSFAVIPRDQLAPLMPELRAVSDAWLASKSGHEKSFSLGSFSDAYMREFDCAVIRDADGIVAFANLWRGAGGEEMSIDLMRYRPSRSKILMDALFARLLLYAKAEGYRWFNLGAAPLSGLTDHRLASRWNKVATLVSRHGDQFYNFEGLKAFKQKFDPVWTPQYIATPGSLSLPSILLDVTALISGGRLGILAK